MKSVSIYLSGVICGLCIAWSMYMGMRIHDERAGLEQVKREYLAEIREAIASDDPGHQRIGREAMAEYVSKWGPP